jgi:60 kDa SS-A/Ro ribonucleoprotein
MKYTTHLLNVPQTEKLSDNQVLNSAGGFVYKLDKWARLRRFLILGSEGGTYYVSERKLVKENAEVVIECIKENAPFTMGVITGISISGQAPKNDPAIFALALVCT